MEWNFDYVELRSTLLDASKLIRRIRPILLSGTAAVDGHIPGREDADRMIDALAKQVRVIDGAVGG